MKNRDYMKEAKDILYGYSMASYNYFNHIKMTHKCLTDYDYLKTYWDVIVMYIAAGLERLDKGTK